MCKCTFACKEFKVNEENLIFSQVGGKKLFTCRALLAYNSPVLARILSSGSTKNKDLDLPEKEYEDVVELLAYIDPRVDYIITGSIPLFSVNP